MVRTASGLGRGRQIMADPDWGRAPAAQDVAAEVVVEPAVAAEQVVDSVFVLPSIPSGIATSATSGMPIFGFSSFGRGTNAFALENLSVVEVTTTTELEAVVDAQVVAPAFVVAETSGPTVLSRDGATSRRTSTMEVQEAADCDVGGPFVSNEAGEGAPVNDGRYWRR